MIFQEISPEELQQKLELVKKLKNQLKNEEMTLVLLKKLKQSQQMTREVVGVSGLPGAGSLGGGATITPTTKQLSNTRNDGKTISRQNSANDMLNSEKLVCAYSFHYKI